MKNIAIVGCGFSGSLLAYFLPRLGYNVNVFETRKSPKVVCAGGISTSLFEKTARECGLNPSKYLKFHGKHLIVRIGSQEVIIDIGNFCTFEKYNFMMDIINKSEAEFHFNKRLVPQLFNKYDVIVDASGIRATLGKLSSDRFYVCYQVRASFEELPFPDFLMDFTEPTHDPWYLWMFPLSRNESYVGCGSYNGKQARLAVLDFMNRFSGKILEEQAKILRLNNPEQSLPFVSDKVVGVGNSIGAITSLGEGNMPSITTVKILLKNITDLDRYQKIVLKELSWIKHDQAAHFAWSRNRILFLYHVAKCFNHYRKQFKINPINLLLKGFKAWFSSQ